jgi:hypothetical protein
MKPSEIFTPSISDLIETIYSQKCTNSLRTKIALALYFLVFLMHGRYAEAISFDQLTAAQSSAASSGQVVATTVVAASSLGGSRFVRATSNGSINTSGVVLGGNYSHSQDAITTGTTFVRWDGNSDPALQPAGLNGLDLTKDAATGVKITVMASDSAFGQPITVSFIMYDSTDSTGLFKRSRGSFTVNSGISTATDFIIPFSDFVGEGFMGGVDFTKIGAIEMFINGNASTSHDLALSFIGTNGNCDHVPVNGLVVDQCGVCNGDNSRCSDCLGVPNGPDLPGVMCPTGEPGVCADGTWQGVPPLNCLCKRDNEPRAEICDQLDNDCDGVVDEGFDKGAQCSVGVGVCKNDGVKQCAPDGSVTCSVLPKPPSNEICDGVDNDCDGVIDEENPNKGPMVDQCGVCKGDGKSCLDCKGVINGTTKNDECGVCGGDGTSCLLCSTFDQSETLGRLDNGAKEQQIIIRSSVGVLRSIPQARREAKFISQTLEFAQKVTLENWDVSWRFPIIATNCEVATSVCVSTSNVTNLALYRENNLKLRNLATDVLNKVRRYRNGRVLPRDRRLRQAAETQFQANLALSRTVPELQFACVTGTGSASATR